MNAEDKEQCFKNLGHLGRCATKKEVIVLVGLGLARERWKGDPDYVAKKLFEYRDSNIRCEYKVC